MLRASMRNRVSLKMRLRQAVARKTVAAHRLSSADNGNAGSGSASSERHPSQPAPAASANWPGTSQRAQGWLCGQARIMITTTAEIQAASAGSSRCQRPR